MHLSAGLLALQISVSKSLGLANPLQADRSARMSSREGAANWSGRIRMRARVSCLSLQFVSNFNQRPERRNCAHSFRLGCSKFVAHICLIEHVLLVRPHYRRQIGAHDWLDRPPLDDLEPDAARCR